MDKKILNIKGINFSEGMPKICISIMGQTKEEVLDNAKAVLSSNPDLVEWRADYLEALKTAADLESKQWLVAIKPVVEDILAALREIMGEKVIVFTFRSKEEGGESHLDMEQYIELNKLAVDSGKVDIIDVEAFRGVDMNSSEAAPKAADFVSSLVDYAHQKEVKVIGSRHYFEETPEQQRMVEVLMALQYADVDMPKLAVMPKTAGDVARLIDATQEMNARFADRPIITMSMAEEGMVSRFMGEAFGSAVTFASVGKASAPGQINAEGLRMLLELVHSEL